MRHHDRRLRHSRQLPFVLYRVFDSCIESYRSRVRKSARTNVEVSPLALLTASLFGLKLSIVRRAEVVPTSEMIRPVSGFEGELSVADALDEFPLIARTLY
jgi:hypothetical protein